MKHTTKIKVLPLNGSTCIQMFLVISGENIRCRLRIYLGHVSPSCGLKGVLHGSFPKSRPMQMGPSGWIAKFLPQIHQEKIRKKNTFTCHSITKEVGVDTSKLFHTFAAVAAVAAASPLTAVEIFLDHPLFIKVKKETHTQKASWAAGIKEHTKNSTSGFFWLNITC